MDRRALSSSMTDITIMNGQLRFTTGCDEWTVDGDAEKFGALLRGLRCWEDERIWNGWEDKMKGIQKDLRVEVVWNGPSSFIKL
ncbi:hypothetical protein HPP92_025814 [Vanilla planifolia]|uniref:Uncharacterized protein n=1 Tax=Vanilla planifolia TaxID=51239 RepID=A0A835PHX6_VANPL|nr:hypothetical protein HPP92_025814 [Vanilla planifolia]